MTPNTHSTSATAELIERLSELAEKATRSGDDWYTADECRRSTHFSETDSAFIAACDPHTVLALCANGLDHHPMRDRFCEAIMGALMYGANNANPAPPGHWLEQFWLAGNEVYKAQRAAAKLGLDAKENAK